MAKPDPAALAASRLVLVGGDDAYAKSTLVKALLESADSGDETVEVAAGERPLADLLGELGTPPFFSPRRALVVAGVEALDPDAFPGGAACLADALKSLPETALAVLVQSAAKFKRDADEGGGRIHGAAWRKLVKAAGGEVVVLDFDRATLAAELREEAKAAGKEMVPATAQALADMAGSDPAVARAELRKLVAYVGDAPRIVADDLATAVVAEPEYSVFALVDDVVAGRASRALEQYRRLTASATDLKGELFPRLIPVLLAKIRAVRQARALLDAGEDPAAPSEAAVRWLPENSIASERDWLRRKAVDAARKLDRGRLAEMLRILAETDRRLKGLAPSLDDRETVEDAIVRIARAATR